MSFLKSILAYCFAAIMINIFWPLFATPFGLFAGFIAGAIVIGPPGIFVTIKDLSVKGNIWPLIWGEPLRLLF